jgi:hypothetical protein
MATTTNASVYFGYLMDQGEIDKVNDTFKMALMTDSFSFDPDKHKAWDADAWQADTAYSVGDVVKPTTENGYLYRCTSAGTSDSTEPGSWPTVFSNTVSDGGVTWECWSYNTSEDEITQENGYAGPQTLDNQALTEDEANNQSELTFDNETFQADAGASFGPTGSCVVFDDTHAQKPISHQTDFGTTYEPSDDGLIEVKNPRIQTIAQQGVTS